MNKFWKRVKVLVFCLVAGQPALAQHSRASEDTGLLGTKLTAVEKTHDLFTFFNLARTGSETLADHRTLVTFKPTGEAFRSLVTLAVTTDENGTIERLRLEVARSFIDDPRQGIFAADLVKSFLASVGDATTKNDDDIAALALEIHSRSLLNPGRTVLTAQPTPAVPKTPSAGYETYAGKRPEQTVSNRGGKVQATLRNKEEGGTARLEIVLSAAER